MASRTSSRTSLVLISGPQTSSRTETWAAAGHSPNRAQSAFDDAYASGQKRRDYRQAAAAAAGALVLIDACYCDYRSFATWHDRLVQAAARVAAPPDADWALIVGAAFAMAAGHGFHADLAPPHDTARFLLLLRQAADPDCALYAASTMITFLDAVRRDDEATAVEVAARPFESGAGPWSRGHWYSIRGQHALFYQRLDEAAELLGVAVTIARQQAIAPLAKVTAIMQARLAIAQGNHGTITQLLENCEPIDDEREPMWRAVVTQLQSLALLCAGSYHEALHCAHRAIAWAQRAQAPADEAAQMHVLEAYCVMAIGDGAAAALKFRRAAAQTSGQQARVVSLLAQLAEADVTLLRGDAPSGRRLLGSAVAEIRALEYGAFFWPLPVVAARLCAHALALDIEPDYMRSIVRHRKLSPPRHAPAAWPWAVMIRALGRFDIEVAGVPLRGAGSKAQAKPLAMLACLVALGANAVPIATITQMLWRGEGREGVKSAFAVTLHRLRQLLGNAQWLTVDNGRVTLDPDHVWIDHRALRIALDAMDVATPTDRTSADLDAMLALYTGPLLADDPGTWARAARDQLRMRVDATVARYAGALPPVRCRALLSRALAADPGLAMAAKMLAALA